MNHLVTVATSERPSAATGRPAGSCKLTGLLGEFESLLKRIPPEAYNAVPHSGEATIARHVGRCLDLIDTLVVARSARAIVYQPRDGGADDLDASLLRVQALQDLVGNWPRRSLDGVIRVDQTSWPLGFTERGWSTLGNELAFVVNHVVDRQKTIERVMKSFGFSVPQGFGSTALQPLRARSSIPPAWALWRLLDELDSLLSDVAPDVYCARFATDVSGSIGEHVRHCLDHVSTLAAADASTTLNYDRRQRGTSVETDPAEAVRQILQLKRAIETWSTRSLDEPIRVTSMISLAGDAVSGWSTLARELAFVVSHTIHHQAMIGLLLAIHGHAVPERLGHSPSTPRRN